MDKTRKIGSLLIFIAFLNLFLFRRPGLGAIAIFFLGTTIFIISAFFRKQAYQQAGVLLGTLCAVLVSLSITLFSRDQGFVQFVTVLSGFTVGLLLTYSASSGFGTIRSLLELITVPISLALAYLVAGAKTTLRLPDEVPASKKDSKFLSTLKTVGVGLLIGLPIVFVLVNLFSSADPIYASFVKKIFTIKFSQEIVTRVIFSSVVGLFLIPFVNISLKKPAFQIHSLLYDRSRAFIHEMTVVVSMVALALGSFLLVQWRYIFISVPKETDLSAFGIKTYSEYVQKGFIELLFISLILYVLIWVGLIIMRGKSTMSKQWLRIAQLVVLSEFALFLFSIFRRIWLYQSHHGWSLVRIYGGFFLLWVCFITATLLLRHFYAKRWVLVEVIGTALLLLLFTFFNAEHFIVMTHPPTVNNRVDHVYLSRMSADGYEGWKRAFAYAQETLDREQGSSFLDKNTRRDIFYAGLIVQHLLLNYERYSDTYTTPDEYRRYKVAVLTNLANNHRQELQRLEALVASQFKPVGIAEKTTLEIDLERGILQQQRFDATLAKLATDSAAKLPKFGMDEYSHGYYNINTESCTPNNYLQDFRLRNEKWQSSTRWCDATFYDLVSWESDAKLAQGLDWLFVFNASQGKAFNQMTTDIPLGKLLELQDTYFNLHRRILEQPASEREIEVDISFDTPFL